MSSPDSELHHRPLLFSNASHDSPHPMSATSRHANDPGSGRSPPAPLAADKQPTLWGMPLKYVSLVTLAVQNALLIIIMHYSRVSTAPSKTYSAASAVLLNELLKGSISVMIALSRIDLTTNAPDIDSGNTADKSKRPGSFRPSWDNAAFRVWKKSRRLAREVFSPDCWKLSIPAILYVIQNNLQFVAASNLDVATFQVTYQMKILTTAGFSVLLLRKRIDASKWLALFFLALGVGIVQIQSGHTAPRASSTPAHSSEHTHSMHPLHGFFAVTAACLTSGLAGVYFEMVLKGSQADLWVRNIQLSLFSLLPALVPVLFASTSNSRWPLSGIFNNFGGWAWATVLIQVFGGLVTAVVIKYSDNILKGFATSLSIIISFLASVELFDFPITPAFIVGSATVLAATALYNRPSQSDHTPIAKSVASQSVGHDAPILGQLPKKSPSVGLGKASPRSIAFALGLSSSPPTPSEEHVGRFVNGSGNLPAASGNEEYGTPAYPYAGSPFRTPSPGIVSHPPSRPPSRPLSTRPSMVSLHVPGAPSGLHTPAPLSRNASRESLIDGSSAGRGR